jgi:hypothetical protein
MARTTTRSRHRSATGSRKTGGDRPAQAGSPDWVVRMHQYHSQTGLYSAEDLNRVLGDPREQVSGEPITELALACSPSHSSRD